jgi:hypothetical protein
VHRNEENFSQVAHARAALEPCNPSQTLPISIPLAASADGSGGALTAEGAEQGMHASAGRFQGGGARCRVHVRGLQGEELEG